MRPGDETERTIERALSATSGRPNEDGKKTGTYIWRTRGDNKVRSEHAERDGKVFSWGYPPEGGHPGEAPNCRCTAESTVKSSDRCKELANKIENAKLQLEEDKVSVDRARAYLLEAKEDYVSREDYFWRQLFSAGLEELIDGFEISEEILERALKAIDRIDLLQTLTDAWHETTWAANKVQRYQESLDFLQAKLDGSGRNFLELSEQFNSECRSQ